MRKPQKFSREERTKGIKGSRETAQDRVKKGLNGPRLERDVTNKTTIGEIE